MFLSIWYFFNLNIMPLEKLIDNNSKLFGLKENVAPFTFLLHKWKGIFTLQLSNFKKSKK